MYLDHYGLQREPFNITPDPYFFYLSPSHRESYASVLYGLKNRKGFLSLTGEVGLGKTTVVRAVLKKWCAQSKIKIVYVFNSNLSFKGLLLTIYSELGLDLPRTPDAARDGQTAHSLPLEDECFELVRKLYSVLVQEYQAGYLVILIIDDAQNMPEQTLENLRMLSNLETTRDKLLQILLIGQPELDKTLNKQGLRQLRQRIAFRATLKPLSDEQTKDYIEHRLKKAGLKSGYDKLFSKSALKRICKFSQGIPRKINIVCDNALITGLGYGRKSIGYRIIKEVEADLLGETYSAKLKYAVSAGVAALLLTAGAWLSPYGKNLLSGKEAGLSGEARMGSAPVQDFVSDNVHLHSQLVEHVPAYSGLSATRQQVLLAMAGQLSLKGLLDFELMLDALEQGDFNEASRQMLNSSWARAVGEEARDLAEAMRTDIAVK